MFKKIILKILPKPGELLGWDRNCALNDGFSHTDCYGNIKLMIETKQNKLTLLIPD